MSTDILSDAPKTLFRAKCGMDYSHEVPYNELVTYDTDTGNEVTQNYFSLVLGSTGVDAHL